MKTAAQMAANWAGSAQRASTDWQAGVGAYAGDWAGATTRQQAVMANNWNAAIASGRWAAGINRIGTQGWKTRTQDASQQYILGFQAGATRQAASAQKIMSALQNIVPNLPPRGTYAQNQQR